MAAQNPPPSGSVEPTQAPEGRPALNFKDTLHLPQTAFSMRANLAVKEPQVLQRWAELGLWEAIGRSRAGQPRFVLHDGPPYANGALHHGHILNKLLKDFVVKDRTMAGLDVCYVPGWDCHGLPIEVQVDKALGGKKAEMAPEQVHAACRAHAEGFVRSQREAFVRLGVQGRWSAPYRTMDPGYEAQIMREVATLMDSGLVYKSLRPVHWCTVHQTALAEAEVEYEDHTSPSIYVGMRALEDAAGPLHGLDRPIDLLIWTTTPWSLPGNVGIIVHPERDYVVFELGDRAIVVAEPCLEATLEALGSPEPSAEARARRVLRRVRGEQLVGVRYQHPFLPRDGQVVADTFVAMDAGTGCVHCAPAHGAEDFAIGQRCGLPVIGGVDARGIMTAEAGPFAGEKLQAASAAIVASLHSAGALLSDPARTTSHRYAHCWRCHKPIITRATEQWFVAMDRPFAGGGTLRERAMAALGEVKWVPGWGVERIGGMLRGRPDWCLSRQRTWGVPIPILYCEACDTPLCDAAGMRRVADRVAEQGASCWYTESIDALFGPVACAACGGTKMRKETDILDVWFDSGVSYAAVLEAEGIGHAEGPPADLYLEGSDQHRGWFHSSLLTSLATRQRPPYRAVLTHGFVVDGQGRKISKSRGNFVDPFAAIAKEGAELWRLWTASEDYQQDVRISPEIMRRLGDSYRKVRNTLRYLLGNLHDFDPSTQQLSFAELLPLDAWAIAQADAAHAQIVASFASYNFHAGLQRLVELCGTDLSAFYLDVLKDRLYASSQGGRERRSAQTALYTLLHDLVRTMAPLLAFTAEEVFLAMPHERAPEASVHMAHYPGVNDAPHTAALRAAARAAAPALSAQFAAVPAVRRVALAALEAARRDKQIGSATEAALTFHGDEAALAALDGFREEVWAELIIVSQVHIQRGGTGALSATVAAASGQKCPRCWLYRPLLPCAGSAVCGRCRTALEPAAASV